MRARDERGNAGLGCLIIVVLFFVLFGCFAAVGGLSGGSSDCYSTPGAEEGSAQNQRDIQRCIKGDGQVNFVYIGDDGE